LSWDPHSLNLAFRGKDEVRARASSSSITFEVTGNVRSDLPTSGYLDLADRAEAVLQACVRKRVGRDAGDFDTIREPAVVTVVVVVGESSSSVGQTNVTSAGVGVELEDEDGPLPADSLVAHFGRTALW